MADNGAQSNKLVTAVAKRKPPAAGMGRKKGSVNKVPAKLKDMILNALNKAGGEEYLCEQARESPSAFLALIGKVLPTTLQGTGEDGEIAVKLITRRVVDASEG